MVEGTILMLSIIYVNKYWVMVEETMLMPSTVYVYKGGR